MGRGQPYPIAKKVEVRGENAALIVKVPPKMDVASIARHEGQLARRPAPVKGLRVLPHPSGDMGLCRVEVLNRALASGTPLHELTAPAIERYLTVGYGFSGAVSFDLDDEVGLGVFGATGAGKGILARWVAVQVLDPARRREVWIVDPQSSGEWSPFADVPGVRLLRYDPTRAVASLTAIVDALHELAVDVAARNELCRARGVDAWRYLPDDVKADVPRRVLLGRGLQPFGQGRAFRLDEGGEGGDRSALRR